MVSVPASHLSCTELESGTMCFLPVNSSAAESSAARSFLDMVNLICLPFLVPGPVAADGIS